VLIAYFIRTRAVDSVKASMQSSILIRNPETSKFMVNFDPSIWELLSEAKYFTKIGLDIPDTAFRLCLKEEKITKNEVCVILMHKIEFKSIEFFF